MASRRDIGAVRDANGTGGSIAVTIRKNSPGCPCCDCILFSDNFDRSDADPVDGQWSVETGDWEVSSNELVSSNEGIVLNTFEHPNNPLHIEVKVRGSDGDRLRVVFDYIDDDNFSFAEIKVGTDAKIRIVERIEGVDNQLGIDASVTAAASTWHTVKVCISSSSAAMNLGSVGIYRWTSVANLPFGLATESGGLFDDFVLSIAYIPGVNDCPSCQLTQLCESCDGGVRSYWMKVVISGLADGTCECSRQNGTHIIPATTQSENICYWQGPAEEDGACGDEYSTDLITVWIESADNKVAFKGGIQIRNNNNTRYWEASWVQGASVEKPYDCVEFFESLVNGTWRSAGTGARDYCSLSGTNGMVIESV